MKQRKKTKTEQIKTRSAFVLKLFILGIVATIVLSILVTKNMDVLLSQSIIICLSGFLILFGSLYFYGQLCEWIYKRLGIKRK